MVYFGHQTGWQLKLETTSRRRRDGLQRESFKVQTCKAEERRILLKVGRIRLSREGDSRLRVFRWVGHDEICGESVAAGEDSAQL
jgi:hypothetical protein